MIRKHLYDDIDRECWLQAEQGYLNSVESSPEYWILVTAQGAHACKQHRNPSALRAGLVKVTAILIAWIEALDRQLQ